FEDTLPLFFVSNILHKLFYVIEWQRDIYNYRAKNILLIGGYIEVFSILERVDSDTKLHVVDVDETKCMQLRRQFSDNRLIIHNVDIIQINNWIEKFDMIIMNFVLEHLYGDTKKVLELCETLLELEGDLFISSWLPIVDEYDIEKNPEMYKYIHETSIDKLKTINLPVRDSEFFEHQEEISKTDYNDWLKFSSQYTTEKEGGLKHIGTSVFHCKKQVDEMNG
ncbi:class I SAM-dependent methyltransferase, partial [Lentibacillus sp. L22]